MLKILALIHLLWQMIIYDCNEVLPVGEEASADIAEDVLVPVGQEAFLSDLEGE